MRATIATNAARYGFAPIASSTHPFAEWDAQRHTDKERYNVIVADLQMIAQRMLHRDRLAITDEDGRLVPHTPELIHTLFDKELERLVRQLPADAGPEAEARLREACRLCEQMILRGEFNPV